MIFGTLQDKYGLRLFLFVLIVIICLGQGIITYGGYSNSFTVMLVGRSIYGIGAESINVSQASMVSKWFIHYELAFAQAARSSIPLVGSLLGGATTLKIY